MGCLWECSTLGLFLTISRFKYKIKLYNKTIIERNHLLENAELRYLNNSSIDLSEMEAIRCSALLKKAAYAPNKNRVPTYICPYRESVCKRSIRHLLPNVRSINKINIFCMRSTSPAEQEDKSFSKALALPLR